MQRLNLDFVAHKDGFSWLGVVLLFGAIVMLVELLSVYSELSDTSATAEWQLQRLQRELAHYNKEKPATETRKERASEISQANDIARRLALPWDRLFAALESASEEHVVLLSIQPDDSKNRLTVTGEARDVTAMLDYLRRLQQQSALSNVYLISHEIVQQDPQNPVRFSLTSSWTTK